MTALGHQFGLTPAQTETAVTALLPGSGGAATFLLEHLVHENTIAEKQKQCAEATRSPAQSPHDGREGRVYAGRACVIKLSCSSFSSSVSRSKSSAPGNRI